jgi:hypothetical protein
VREFHGWLGLTQTIVSLARCASNPIEGEQQ